MRTIDIHCHLATPDSRKPVETYFRPEFEPYDFFMGTDSKVQTQQMMKTIGEELTDPEPRLNRMDEMGVQMQGLSTFVSEYAYWAPAPEAAESARIQNDRLAAIAADYPARFVVIGATLPMQDVDLALREMERAGDLGIKGFQIGGTVNGLNLDDGRFEPFWEEASRRRVPILIHPNGFPESQRLDDYFLTNCIGNPLETTVAMTRLIFAGVLERHRDLRLILLHGGGYLPFYASRADHTWKVRPETRRHIPDHPPSHYLKSLYFDTMVYQPIYLRHLVELVGVERVMLGTDYPFDMGDTDPLVLISETEILTDSDRAALAGENAAKLYGLD